MEAFKDLKEYLSRHDNVRAEVDNDSDFLDEDLVIKFYSGSKFLTYAVFTLIEVKDAYQNWDCVDDWDALRKNIL